MSHLETKADALARRAPCHEQGLRQMVALNPARGFQLLRDCPAMAMLVLRDCSRVREPQRSEELRAMLALPWRELLQLFDLPPRPRTMKVLGMLPLDHCREHTVVKLQRALQTRGHPWLHVLPHLPLITRDTVSLLLVDPRFVNPHLLRASTRSDFDSEDVTWTVAHIRQMLNERGCTVWPYPQATFAQLKMAEGRLFQREYEAFCLPFPAPPLPGLPGWIEPLCDYASLADEGAAQENCVAMLVGDIVGESIYAYAVHRPERATLALRRNEATGRWERMELRAAHNAEVSPETENMVERWINSCRGKGQSTIKS